MTQLKTAGCDCGWRYRSRFMWQVRLAAIWHELTTGAWRGD